ncbi:MAG: ABC-type transport auxiliary lipoprotein family protein [Thermodesulfobacteriota bacterium]
MTARPPVPAAAWILALALLGAAGCAGPAALPPEVVHLGLEYPSPGPAPGLAIPVVLGVRQLAAVPPFDTDRLLFREQAFRLEAYFYHRWQADPGQLVTTALVRELRGRQRLAGVVTEDSAVQPRLWLEGSVEEFVHWHGADGWEAVVAVHLLLMDREAPATQPPVLWRRGYQARRPCASPHPEDAAAAMSAALAELASRVAGDLEAQLAGARP